MPVSRSERDFLNLSEALTGFDRVELEGTGISTVYYQTVRQIVGGLIFGRLLLTWRELADHVLPALHTEAEREAAIRQRFFDDPRLGAMLGPIVQNIITLWYIGNWNQLPRVWRNRWGANARDLPHVVSAEAYQEGLIWRAILAHPPDRQVARFRIVGVSGRRRGAIEQVGRGISGGPEARG